MDFLVCRICKANLKMVFYIHFLHDDDNSGKIIKKKTVSAGQIVRFV